MSNNEEFDVFLSHNGKDKTAARAIKRQLETRGIRAWLDEDELRPGMSWPKLIAEALRGCKSIAVLVGPSGIGPWEAEEIELALINAVNERRPVIPVFLPDAPETHLPSFLASRGYVDYRAGASDTNLLKLEWGITGVRPPELSWPQKLSIQSHITSKHEIENKTLAHKAIELLLSDTNSPSVASTITHRQSVTQFLKIMVNRSVETQRDTLLVVKKIYERSTTSDRIELAYILGRLEDEGARTDAKEYLQSRIETFIDSSASGASDGSSLELLLKRTLYVSLAYLGSQHAVDEYCDLLIKSSVDDDLNRGFHLEYYGDTTYLPRRENGAEWDAIDMDFPRTFDILSSKVREDLRLSRPRIFTPIEVQTLFSLALNRHTKGRLSPSRKAATLDLLNDLRLARYSGLPKTLISYLDMCGWLLSNEVATPSEIVIELFKLKHADRQGWRSSFPDANPESVAAHTWGAIMVATLFLPESLPEEPTYCKRSVIELLIIHDLTEAFTGDIPLQNKAYESTLIESDIIRRLSSLGSLKEFPGAASLLPLWEEFHNSIDVNGQIARDIERIDMYLQYKKYRKIHLVEAAAMTFFEEFETRISTGIGRSILARLRIDTAH
jgi:5'-deoxynucleotidase YfbR-like HD superfamily hydrolase